MTKPRSRYRWFVVFVFFCFVLLHQADKLLIGPLTTPIMETFGINEAQMGAVSSLAVVGLGRPLPLWGYLYDRFARARLLALASFIWGSTTWLNALAPNYHLSVTRASTGSTIPAIRASIVCCPTILAPRCGARSMACSSWPSPSALCWARCWRRCSASRSAGAVCFSSLAVPASSSPSDPGWGTRAPARPV